MNAKNLIAISAVMAAAAAQAGEMEKRGLHFGERLTLRPYVSLSYTYDSNIDSGKHSKSGSQWVVNPGVNAEYKDDNWEVTGNVYYQYHAYNRYVNQLNSSTFGESLGLKWKNSARNEKGWGVNLSESFRIIAQDDDMTESGGRGIGRDRKEGNLDGVVERRLNEYMRLAALGNFYYLDYDNDVKKYAPLFGWQREVVGGEVGFAPNGRMEIILHGNYQWYKMDDDVVDYYDYGDRKISNKSKGWSLLAGLGSRADERISYRVLAGWSRFEYGNGAKDCDGFTYQISGKMTVGEEDDMCKLYALGSSYYQPSEREYASALKVYTASVGINKGFVRAKVGGSLDLAFRKETHEYSQSSENDYDMNVWTARARLSYRLNRYLDAYGSLEYQMAETLGNKVTGHYYDYDRVRATLGLRLTY